MHKIAIIGGGWVGCHLASKLQDNHQVTIFEQNEFLFGETSYKNQNRLHMGYHYARNYGTREMCRTTYARFLHDYSQFAIPVKDNLYCVPNKSVLDFCTILKIFDEYNFSISKNPFDNLEGSISTDEMYIDFRALFDHWNKTLKHLVVHKSIQSYAELDGYDYIIDATNNALNSSQNSFYELTISLLYSKKRDLPFGAATLIDGNFFSIYPYTMDGIYTLTDVEHTPIATFSNIKNLKSYKLDDVIIDDKITKMETKVKEYWPEFYNYLTFKDYVVAMKSKPYSGSANRYPVISRQDNVIKCFTGKIQGIYIIEDTIKTML